MVTEENSGDVEQIRITDLEEATDPGRNSVVELKAIEAASAIKLSLIMAGILVVGVGVVLWITLPTQPRMQSTAETFAGTTLATYSEVRTAWFSSVGQLLGLFLQPIFAIMASIAGYAFGARQAS